MNLILEIEYLSGVSFAAVGPDADVPDWPPQPDRIFSALTASWAARGQDEAEATSLEWLEGLPPPLIVASAANHRSSAVGFVPPNDARSDKQKHSRDVLPAMRRRQPRRFPAALPHDPVVKLFWSDAETDQQTLIALQQLASDTAYVGHSASLTRCSFRIDNTPGLPAGGQLSKRRAYPGRLTELRRAFDAGKRPLPGEVVAPLRLVAPSPAHAFSEHWLLLEHISGDMPDLRASALVAKAIRDTLLSGYRQIGLGDNIPEIVSGHTTDGRPSVESHLAIIPLPFTGFPYADGHVMGFGLVPPVGSDILEDDDFRRALRKLAPVSDDHSRRILTVATPNGTAADRAFSITLSPVLEPPVGKRSLDPDLYTRSSHVFATTTPIILDRHLKKKGEAREKEIAAQIASACRNIGLPAPDIVVADKHAAIEGTPSAYPSGNSPAWMRWRLPSSLENRQLTHAVIEFSEPIAGPVILGAGRFVGLGLCRPLIQGLR